MATLAARVVGHGLGRRTPQAGTADGILRGGEADAGGGAGAGVLAPDQGLGLERPGHDLAVQQHPVGRQLLEHAGPLECGGSALEHASRIGGSLKNGRPERVHTEPRSPVATPNRLRAVSASRHATMSAREPMCFSWQTTVADAFAPIVVQRLARMLEVAVGSSGLARRHGRRQVDQPARVDGEPAHHLQGRSHVLLADRHRRDRAGY